MLLDISADMVIIVRHASVNEFAELQSAINYRYNNNNNVRDALTRTVFGEPLRIQNARCRVASTVHILLQQCGTDTPNKLNRPAYIYTIQLIRAVMQLNSYTFARETG